MTYINDLKAVGQLVQKRPKSMTIAGAALLVFAMSFSILMNQFLFVLPAAPIILLGVYVTNKAMNMIYQGTYSTYKYIKEDYKSDSQTNTTRINSVLGIRANITNNLSDAKLEEGEEKQAAVILPPSPQPSNNTSTIRRSSP